MKIKKMSKDEIQKIVLSAIGFVALIYCYFTFFLGPLLRGGYLRLDLGPLRLGRVQLIAHLDRLVGVPAVPEKEDRAEGDQRIDAELQRIALALALLGELFV